MENAYEMYTKYLYNKAGSEGIPFSGTFEITSRCNLDCRMCYIHKRINDKKALGMEKDTAYWLNLADECVKAGTMIMLITGGEPLVREDFKEIYSYCKSKGMVVSLNSNATLIDDDMVEFFKNDPPSRINITLYGASRETYGRLCGDPTAYDKVIHAIKTLKEAGVLIKINYSVTPYNIDDADKIFEFVKEMNLALQVAYYMYPPIRACEMGCFKSVRLTPDEAARFKVKYDKARYEDEGLKIKWRNELNRIVADKEIEEIKEPEKIMCHAGYSSFWITWDGKMRPCGMMTYPDISFKQGNFLDGWKELKKSREEIFFPKKCSTCGKRDVCDSCPAVCYAENKDFEKEPEFMCELTDAYIGLIQSELNE